MCGAGSRQSFPSPPCFACQRFLEHKFSSCVLAGQAEQASAGKGFFTAKLQQLRWESRALLSRRFQNHRGTGTALAGSEAQAANVFIEVTAKGKLPLVLSSLGAHWH